MEKTRHSEVKSLHSLIIVQKLALCGEVMPSYRPLQPDTSLSILHSIYIYAPRSLIILLHGLIIANPDHVPRQYVNCAGWGGTVVSIQLLHGEVGGMHSYTAYSRQSVPFYMTS